MECIEVIKNPKPEDTKAIIDGVYDYGVQQVGADIPQKYTIKLMNGKEIIGGLVGAVQYRRFYLSHLWVNEENRRMGYGSKLIDELEKQVKNIGCNSIILETLNKDAVTFYLNKKYNIVSCIKNYVEGFDLVYLCKAI